MKHVFLLTIIWTGRLVYSDWMIRVLSMCSLLRPWHLPLSSLHLQTWWIWTTNFLCFYFPPSFSFVCIWVTGSGNVIKEEYRTAIIATASKSKSNENPIYEKLVYYQQQRHKALPTLGITYQLLTYLLTLLAKGSIGCHTCVKSIFPLHYWLLIIACHIYVKWLKISSHWKWNGAPKICRLPLSSK